MHMPSDEETGKLLEETPLSEEKINPKTETDKRGQEWEINTKEDPDEEW